jgi:hypothetical protein
LAILLVALLADYNYPLAGQARLVQRVSGQEMQAIAVEKDPKSCCASNGLPQLS